MNYKYITQESYYASRIDDGESVFYSLKHYYDIDIEKEWSTSDTYIIDDNDITYEGAGWGLPVEWDRDIPITKQQFEKWVDAICKAKTDIADFCLRNSRPHNGVLKAGDYIFQYTPAYEDQYRCYDASSFISKVLSAKEGQYEVIPEVFNDIYDVLAFTNEGNAENVQVDIESISQLSNERLIDIDAVNKVKEMISTFTQQLMSEIDDELDIEPFYETKEEIEERAQGYDVVILVKGVLTDYSIADLPNGECALWSSGPFEREFWEEFFPLANLTTIYDKDIQCIYIVNLPTYLD